MDRPLSSTSTDSSQSGVMSTLAVIALGLLIVGGLNRALVGLFSFDLVAAIFGTMTPFTRIVYVLVGLAAVYALTLFPRITKPA